MPMDIKKILAAIAVLCQGSSVLAEDAKKIQLYPFDPNMLEDSEHRFQVIFDNDVFVISNEACSASNDDVHIIVTDENGTVVADEHISLSGQGGMISLPVDSNGKTYKIEIESGDTYLYGYVNNQ